MSSRFYAELEQENNRENGKRQPPWFDDENPDDSHSSENCEGGCASRKIFQKPPCSSIATADCKML
jgi:hypothetical protein